MIARLLRRQLSRETELFAEAQALLDDGLDLDFVLALYPDDAEWLTPLLNTAGTIVRGYAEEPSYYFEASLKSRFLAAGQAAAARKHAPVPVTLPAPAVASGGTAALARLQTTLAAAVVVLALGSLGILTLGFVTADQALPGDWNYAFKRASEQIEYTLSRGEERVSVQVRQQQTRVEEFKRQAEQGNVTAESVERFRKTLEETQRLAQEKHLDEVQAATVRAIGEAAGAVLTGVAEKQPDLAEAVEQALPIAAGLGDVTPLDPATPEPTAETATPGPGAEPSPAETATPEPSETATGDEATATAEATPEPSETAAAEETPSASPEGPAEAP